MNKRAGKILMVALVFLCIAFFLLWRFSQPKQTDLELLQDSSLLQARQSFEAFALSGQQSEYWDGVANFRCFMQAYLILCDGSTADYLACNRVYGRMLLNPERVQENMDGLCHALGLLCDDKSEINGFLRMSELANALDYG